jgi:hypothetical protein
MLVAVWFMSGCHPPADASNLRHLVVEGGTAEEVAAVHAAWRDFDLDVKLPLPEVSKVVLFDELVQGEGPEADGRYVHERREIQLRRGRDLGHVMYHELCHALDLQYPLSTWARTDFPAEADFSWAATELATQRMEAFAGICDLQRNGVAILASVLAGCDDDNFMPVVEFLNDNIFSPSDSFDISGEVTYSFRGDLLGSSPFRFQSLHGISTTSNAAVLFATSENDPYFYGVDMNLETGALSEPVPLMDGDYVNDSKKILDDSIDDIMNISDSIFTNEVFDVGIPEALMILNFDFPGVGRHVSTLAAGGSTLAVARDACFVNLAPTIVSSDGRIVAGDALAERVVVIDYTNFIQSL